MPAWFPWFLLVVLIVAGIATLVCIFRAVVRDLPKSEDERTVEEAESAKYKVLDMNGQRDPDMEEFFDKAMPELLQGNVVIGNRRGPSGDIEIQSFPFSDKRSDL